VNDWSRNYLKPYDKTLSGARTVGAGLLGPQCPGGIVDHQWFHDRPPRAPHRHGLGRWQSARRGRLCLFGVQRGNLRSSHPQMDRDGQPHPASGTWSVSGELAVGRGEVPAVLLCTGRVLVCGGPTNTVEISDPPTGTWFMDNNMNIARAYHSATPLPSGKVLVAGGYHGSYLASAEVYDPGVAPVFALGSVSKTPEGSFVMNFTGPPGISLTVLSTTNVAAPLTNWIPLAGGIELSPGWYQFTDPQAAGLACRFYRLQR
jgi:hypothetical protein